MNVITSLRALLGLGDAEAGTDHWWGQRLSGVALVVLGLWFVASLIVLPSLEYNVMVEFIGRPLNRALLSLAVVTATYHSHLGVQVVIEDYIPVAGLHKASLIASRIAHVVVAAAAVVAIYAVGAGA